MQSTAGQRLHISALLQFDRTTERSFSIPMANDFIANTTATCVLILSNFNICKDFKVILQWSKMLRKVKSRSESSPLVSLQFRFMTLVAPRAVWKHESQILPDNTFVLWLAMLIHSLGDRRCHIVCHFLYRPGGDIGASTRTGWKSVWFKITISRKIDKQYIPDIV